MSGSNYLVGKFLVAMPTMQDARFLKAVILICGHDENGAMGIVINRPLVSLTFKDLLDNLKIPSSQDFSNIHLYFGGPVEVGRGVVLHTDDYEHESTIHIKQGLSLSATADVLQSVIDGRGPKKMLIALGYSGWSAKQLDHEIIANDWIVIDFSEKILFDDKIEDKWRTALSSAGIDPDQLSLEGGSA